MAKQMFLGALFSSTEESNEEQPSEIRILNWNLRNPSAKRAQQQAEWIIDTKANIVVLTEAKKSSGCELLLNWLERDGFEVFSPQFEGDGYCVLAATRGFKSKKLEHNATFLPERVLSISCETPIGNVSVIGLYVPSRGPLERRNIDKRSFQDQITRMLRTLIVEGQTNHTIICGDLNIVERDHVPHYPVFGEWEYEFYESFVSSGLTDAYRLQNSSIQDHSWYGRFGDGYRFDHFFISQELSDRVSECVYIHTVRSLGLSDHSAMYLSFKLPSTSKIG